MVHRISPATGLVQGIIHQKSKPRGGLTSNHAASPVQQRGFVVPEKPVGGNEISLQSTGSSGNLTCGESAFSRVCCCGYLNLTQPSQGRLEPSPASAVHPRKNSPNTDQIREAMAPKYAAAHLIPKKEDGKEDRKAVARSRSNYLRVHFKNTRETAAALTGLKLAKALSYLGDVIEHKQCVPFRRFSGGVGRTAQAKAHKTTQGRWPVKSAKYMVQLLKNAQANAVANQLEPEDLVITSINVNQAPKTRRRTYRAHGRINPYQGHPCHVEIILTPVSEEVEKADEVVVTKRRATKTPKTIAAA
ncbi:hypothetical protein O181_000568 [Austropuccinia psidii MF-1]|uniref:Ribosomal protein L22 n=1 Tax=Austropuccinia psidii MF-1 TaxID=1389203 RepID=A0A9Q3GAZ6_9BASI|nr:hypothetical protein [Austropuccinia psidii MF-1]